MLPYDDRKPFPIAQTEDDTRPQKLEKEDFVLEIFDLAQELYASWNFERAAASLRFLLWATRRTRSSLLFEIRAWTLCLLADIRRGEQRLFGEDSAFQYYTSSYRIWEKIGDWTQCIMTLLGMGLCFKRDHRHDESLKYYLKAVRLCEDKIKDPSQQKKLQAFLSGNIAFAYLALDRFQDALDYIEKSLRDLENIDVLDYHRGGTFVIRSHIFGALGDKDQAMRDASEGDALTSINAHRYNKSKALVARAEALVAMREIEEAEEWLEKALQIHEQLPLVPTNLERAIRLVERIGSIKQEAMESVKPLQALIIGSFEEDRRKVLQRIAKALPKHIAPIFLDTTPSRPGESLESKFHRLVWSSPGTFILAEASVKSGHIDEVKLAKDSNLILARLHEAGKRDTLMQLDYPYLSPFIKDFEYSTVEELSKVVKEATSWALARLLHRTMYYRRLYRRG